MHAAWYCGVIHVLGSSATTLGFGRNPWPARRYDTTRPASPIMMKLGQDSPESPALVRCRYLLLSCGSFISRHDANGIDMCRLPRCSDDSRPWREQYEPYRQFIPLGLQL